MNIRHLLAACIIIALPLTAVAQQGFGQPSQQSTAQQYQQQYQQEYQQQEYQQQQYQQQGNWNNQPMPQANPYQQMPQQMPQQNPQTRSTMPNAGGMGNMPGNGGMGAGMTGVQQPAMSPGMMNQLQGMLQAELQDFGVPPTQQLHDVMHGPTPTSIPGGQVITTDRLMMLYQQGQQNGLLVFDVLNGNLHLPMAQNALGAAQAGSFKDQTQQQFGQYLEQVTQGNKARPMVFYCAGPQCWMSYNAALRAINLGYSQVYWYRGGIEAWGQIQQMAMSMPQQGMPGAGQYGQAAPAAWPGNQ